MTNLIWQIPEKIMHNTAKVLASKDLEVFVLWTSTIKMEGNVCKISRLVIPEQDSHKGLEGVYVHIEGKELSRITFDNYPKGERNVIQIHTHPSQNVDMSILDREWEVVNHVGALSIIVPNYGTDGLRGFPGVHVYEKEEDGWRLWPHEEIIKRLEIV